MVATERELENLEKRRRDLEGRLREKGALKNEADTLKQQDEKPQMGQAMKLASEFLAAVVVGVLLGLGFDQITGFAPWGLVVFLFLGFASGVLNMLRAVGYVKPNQIEYRRERD